jgi:hypothetical protein
VSFLSLHNFCLKIFLILRRIDRDIVKISKRLHVKYPLFCRVSIKLEFSRQSFEKQAQVSSFVKIRQVRAKLFHADGLTDMTKLTVAFRNFTNAPKN